MNLPEPIEREQSLAEKVSRVSFFLYFLFVLVGTAPFQETVTDVADVSTSNPINQIVDSVIPFVSILCLVAQRKKFFSLLKQEKYLTLFLFWCLATILWSDFPFNSLKLWIRLIGSTTVVLAFLLNLKSPDEALRYLKSALVIYIPLSFLSIAVVPAATQWEYATPAWRGLSMSKNTLGQISFISTFIWAFAVSISSGKKRFSSSLFLLASLILLLGSRSTTALIILLSLLFMAVYLLIDRHLQRINNVGRAASLAMVGCLLILICLFPFSELDSATGIFGKDATFTGRTDLWEAILDEVNTHPIIGCGFGGFWIVDNHSVQRLYEDDAFPWLPNEAHEGYLDILNETGIVGLFLLTMMVISYFKNLSKLSKPHFWKWFFIGILLLNFTESTLFRSGSFAGWFFVFSYLALQVELLQSKHLGDTTPSTVDLMMHRHLSCQT